MDDADYTEPAVVAPDHEKRRRIQRGGSAGPYDTATDLQWDLCGIIVGTLFSCIMLRDSRDQLVPD